MNLTVFSDPKKYIRSVDQKSDFGKHSEYCASNTEVEIVRNEQIMEWNICFTFGGPIRLELEHIHEEGPKSNYILITRDTSLLTWREKFGKETKGCAEQIGGLTQDSTKRHKKPVTATNTYTTITLFPIRKVA